MNTITRVITVGVLLVPAAATASGVGGFYMVSVPSVSVDVYYETYWIGSPDAKMSPVGFGAKFWYSFLPFMAAEVFFSYVPRYDFETVPVDMYVDVSLSGLGFGGGTRFGFDFGPVEPYGSAGISAYRTVMEAEVGDTKDSDTSIDFGVYVGGGMMIDIAGPIKLDVNPVYTKVVDTSMEFLDVRAGVAVIL